MYDMHVVRDKANKKAHLSETENVVNEKQHILAFGITEILSNSQTSKSDTGTGTRGLVHLSVHKSTFALRLLDRKRKKIQ